MATFSNNFFLERKSENIQDNDSTKMWTKKWNKYFSFIINDQTTFMYQFKLRTSNNSYAFFNCLLHQNQQISLILSKQLKFSSKSKQLWLNAVLFLLLRYYFSFLPYYFCFSSTIFCFSSIFFLFFKTQHKNRK